MPKPTKPELRKYRSLLSSQLANLRGDVGSMRDEALRASEQDASVDHLADQGTDNYDQGFLLGLIENEEETIHLIESALERIDGGDALHYGQCPRCVDEVTALKAKKSRKKVEVWIDKARLKYVPWALYCVRHQAEFEQNRESA